MSAAEVMIRVRAYIESDGDGFHGYVPALRGCHAGGATEEETKANLDDAIFLHLRALVQRGIPLPIGCETELIAEESTARGAIPFEGISANAVTLSCEERDISIPVHA